MAGSQGPPAIPTLTDINNPTAHQRVVSAQAA